MADLLAANVACEAAVTGKTHKDNDRAWRRWLEYTDSVGLGSNPFLDGFSRHQQIRLMGAFAMAYREGRFSGPSYECLAEGTVRSALSAISQTFRENDRPNPTWNDDAKLGRFLSRLFRSFKNKDPAPKQQKAIPICVIDELAKLQATEVQKATAQLAVGGFFFAARSCEYLKVRDAKERKTDILRLRCIVFLKDGRVLAHSDPNLHLADCVSITFERQKKDEKNDTVTQRASCGLDSCVGLGAIPTQRWTPQCQQSGGMAKSSTSQQRRW